MRLGSFNVAATIFVITLFNSKCFGNEILDQVVEVNNENLLEIVQALVQENAAKDKRIKVLENKVAYQNQRTTQNAYGLTNLGSKLDTAKEEFNHTRLTIKLMV